MRDNHTETPSQDAKHLTQLLRDLVAQFPQAVPDLNSDAQRPNPIVEKIVRERIRQWDLGLPSHVHEKYFMFGHSIAITAYHHVSSPELQAEIGLFTGLAILVDDAVMGSPAIQEFVTRLCTGSRQLHPSLDRFAETVHGLGKHFTQYGANAIISSTIDFVNSELFQRGARDIDLGLNSIPYTKYMRGKDGYVEAYAAFVWPKDVFPDTKEYIQAFPCVPFINILDPSTDVATMAVILWSISPSSSEYAIDKMSQMNIYASSTAISSLTTKKQKLEKRELLFLILPPRAGRGRARH